MSNRRDNQFTYNPHNKATKLDCSFIVDPADSAGAGVSSLNKSGRISSVYMKTTAAAASGSVNPANGYIVVNLQDNYNKYLSGSSQFSAPLTGSDLAISSGLSIGAVYVITVLGTSTAADWLALGVPANITPAVGVSFFAIATGAGSGSGKVKLPAATGSGISRIGLIGDPNVMNSNGAYTLGAGNGMQLIFACYSTNTITAPASGSKICMEFYLNNSAQGV
jgi:hypothetical protein